ncbi:MAG: restriction endonuclease subunit S [Weeksellaceae bacterium]
MSNWKTYKLSEILNLVGGGTPKTTVSEYWNGNIPWLSVVDFGNCNKYVYQTEKTITEKGLKESSTKILKTGQIIISARGTVGALAMLGKDMAFNQSCYGIYANEKTTNDFLYYLLRDSISRIKKNTHGAVFDTVTKQTFENIEVSIPEKKEEQTQIAQILSSLDDKIELLQQMNQTLENIAQAIFKEWFVDFNFPGFDGELVDGLPKGWRMGKLGEIVDVKGGTTPSTAKEEYWNGEYYWTTPKDLSNIQAPVLIDTERKITELGVKQISSGIMPEGTLLLSSRAPIGYLAISQVPISINQGYIAIQGKSVSNLFMLFWLKQNMDAVKSKANGSTFQEVSKTNFKLIDVVAPEQAVLKQFDDTISPIFKRIVENVYQIQTLTQTRDTLLPKLMSGQLEIKN